MIDDIFDEIIEYIYEPPLKELNYNKLSVTDKNLLREVEREERKNKLAQRVAARKSRKEELRKLYREGKVASPKPKTFTMNYRRLHDYKK